ncbi:MAG TPA: hypothetical protein PKX15_07640, partial [Bacteroidales bacterium]|nr:hypothetical protein [Bacteroidales bacterium]
MYVKVQNENYGYSVATYGNYVAVSNPSTLRYDPENEERLCTGSIDYFRYNKNTDEHDHIATLYQPYEELAVILSREHPTPEYDRWDLMTEKNVEYKFPRSKSIEIDKNDYTKSLEDSFGYSIDMYNKNLIVGSPYFYQAVKTYAYSLTSSIATALIYDLGITETPDSDSESNCLIYKLYDPDLGGEEWNSESFGKSVSINGAWAAVGSPSISGSTGMVYLYQAQPTTSYVEGKPHTVVTWSLFKKLEPPNPEPGMEFGYSLKLNKCTSSLSNSLVVGCGNLSHQKAYYFEYINEAWTQSHVFVPDKTIQPMTFAPYLPWDETPVMNESNGFGSAVSLYNDTVIIGAPYDRIFYEYSGSKLYQQGATYIFERCPHPDDEIYEYPRFPNDQIRWNTPNSTAKSIFNFSASFAGNETKPHALININNKIYGGGWDGKLFVFNDPDNNLTDQTWSDCIVDGWISQVTYSEGTKYLYFITTVTRNDAISGKKGYIIKVNPNNINEQEIIFTWTPGTASIGGTVPEAIPPIASDNSYLYTMLRSNYKTTIYKLDITNGNVIKSVVVSTSSDHLINPAMHGGGVFSPDGKWIYFCGGGYVYKINTDTLEYSSVKVQFFYGIADSEIKWEWDPSTEEFKGYWADVALVDDMAYLDGYIYVVADQSGNAFPGGLFKINAETLENVGYIQYEINDGVINYDRYMDIGGYPLPYGSWGVFSDSTNLYLLMGTTNEIFVYPDGDLDSGPVRYPIIGKPNELAFTKAGNIVYTTFSSPIKAYSYKLPFKYNITYPSLFKQVLKTYGNEKVLKNNRMGWSVDIHGNYAVSGIPKVNVETLDSCYIEGTLEQLHFCDSNYENLFSGQTLLLGKNTSSLNWEIINIYQKKKKYLSPYRSYGFDVAVANKSI